MLLEHEDLKSVTAEEIYSVIELDDDQYLLKVLTSNDPRLKGSLCSGRMLKYNKDGKIPDPFSTFKLTSRPMQEISLYVINERFRTGWRLQNMYHATSTTWVELIHPLGFRVEINIDMFNKIFSNLVIVDGLILNPCYFSSSLKNAELIIQERSDVLQLHRVMAKLAEDELSVNSQLSDLVEKYPIETYEVLSR